MSNISALKASSLNPSSLETQTPIKNGENTNVNFLSATEGSNGEDLTKEIAELKKTDKTLIDPKDIDSRSEAIDIALYNVDLSVNCDPVDSAAISELKKFDDIGNPENALSILNGAYGESSLPETLAKADELSPKLCAKALNVTAKQISTDRAGYIEQVAQNIKTALLDAVETLAQQSSAGQSPGQSSSQILATLGSMVKDQAHMVSEAKTPEAKTQAYNQLLATRMLLQENGAPSELLEQVTMLNDFAMNAAAMLSDFSKTQGDLNTNACTSEVINGQIEALYNATTPKEISDAQDKLSNLQGLLQEAGASPALLMQLGNFDREKMASVKGEQLENAVTQLVQATTSDEISSAAQAIQTTKTEMKDANMLGEDDTLFAEIASVGKNKEARIEELNLLETSLKTALEKNDFEMILAIDTSPSKLHVGFGGKAGQSVFDAREKSLLADIKIVQNFAEKLSQINDTPKEGDDQLFKDALACIRNMPKEMSENSETPKNPEKTSGDSNKISAAMQKMYNTRVAASMSSMEKELANIDTKMNDIVPNKDVTGIPPIAVYRAQISKLAEKAETCLPKDSISDFNATMTLAFRTFCEKSSVLIPGMKNLCGRLDETDTQNKMRQTLIEISAQTMYSPAFIAALGRINKTELNSMLLAFDMADKEPSAKNLEKAWNALDDICMPYPELHSNAFLLKESLIPNENKSSVQKNLEQQHACRVTCSILLDCVKDEKKPSARTITSKYLTTLMENPPKTAQGNPLDILLCDAFIQLRQLENPTNTTEGSAPKNYISELPPHLQSIAHEMLNKFGELGITSTAQLGTMTQMLSSSFLNKGLRDGLHKARTDSGTLFASEKIRAFANIILKNVKLDNNESIKTMDEGKLLTLCAEEMKLNIAIDPKFSDAIEVFFKELTSESELHSMADTLMKNQKVSQPAQLKGETQAINVLTLQRALITKLEDLSDYDLSKLQLPRKTLKDNDVFKQFVADKNWTESIPKNWQKTLLFANYIEAGGKLENLEMSEENRRNISSHIKELISIQTNSANIIRRLNICSGSLKISLEEGRTELTGGDKAGNLLQTLVQAYPTGAFSLGGLGITSVVIGQKQEFGKVPGKEQITLTSGETYNAEDIKKAIIALLNNDTVNITQIHHISLRKKEAITEAISYPQPVIAAHTMIVDKSHRREKSGTTHLDTALKKAFSKQSDLVKTSPLNTLIKVDFAQYAGLEERQIDSLDYLVQESTGTLFRNSTFLTQALPLVLLGAMKLRNVSSLTEFVYNLKSPGNNSNKAVEALKTAFKTLGMDEAVASTLGTALQFKLKDAKGAFALNALQTGIYSMISAYSFAKNIQKQMAIPAEQRTFEQAKQVENDILQVLGSITKGTSLEINTTASAGVDVKIPIGIAKVTPSVKAGMSSGITLWRTEKAKPCLTINKDTFAQVGLAVSFADTVGIAATVEGQKQKGLVITFPDDASCAKFTSLFMTGKVQTNDLALCEKVALSNGKSIAGTISAEVGLEADVAGVASFSLAAGVTAGLTGTYSVTQEANYISKVSATSYELSARAGVAISQKERDGVEIKPDSAGKRCKEVTNTLAENEKSSNTGTSSIRGVVEGSTQGMSAGVEYNFNINQETKVTLNLNETQLSSAQSTASTIIGKKGSAAEHAILFCEKLGVPQELHSAVSEYINRSGNPAPLSTSVSQKLKDEVIRQLTSETSPLTPKQINEIVNNRDNYEFQDVCIAFSTGTMTANSINLLVASEATNVTGMIEKTFKLANVT